MHIFFLSYDVYLAHHLRPTIREEMAHLTHEYQHQGDDAASTTYKHAHNNDYGGAELVAVDALVRPVQQ